MDRPITKRICQRCGQHEHSQNRLVHVFFRRKEKLVCKRCYRVVMGYDIKIFPLVLLAASSLSMGICIIYCMLMHAGYAYFDSIHEGYLEAFFMIFIGIWGFLTLDILR